MIKIRTCIACRTKKSKNELIRIVVKDGIPVIDEIQKENTRGIYICNDKNCINRLLKAKDLSKCIKINTNTENLKELLKNLGE